MARAARKGEFGLAARIGRRVCSDVITGVAPGNLSVRAWPLPFRTSERTVMTDDQTIHRALRILAARMRSGPLLSAPAAVRDYLRLSLHDRGHEVFACIFLDPQHRVLGCDELFRGTLVQTSVRATTT
jgi:hypothetical protein